MVVVKDVYKKKDKYEISFLYKNVINKMFLSEDAVIKYSVHEEKEIEYKDYQDILKFKDFEDVYLKTKTYASRNFRTVSETKLYLNKYDIPENDKLEIVNMLIDLRYINDKDYCVNYIDIYFSKLIGPYKIKNNLMKKGLTERMIDNCLQRITIPMCEANIHVIIEKEMKKKTNDNTSKLMRLLMNRLMRDGYSYSICHDIVISYYEQIKENNNDLEKLKVDYDIIVMGLKKQNKNIDDNRTFIINKLVQKGYDFEDCENIVGI